MKLKRFQIPVWIKRTTMLLLSILWLLPVLYILYELAITISTPICTPDENGFSHVRALLLTMAAWVGAPFLIWRTWLADRQTRINRESHHTDLFTKAVELLSATCPGEDGKPIPAIESRIGAIFALERLAKQSQSDYGTIIETLSVYVREQCGKPSTFVYDGEDPDEDGIAKSEHGKRLTAWYKALWIWLAELKKEPPANRADVVVALTALSRRKEGRNWTVPDDEQEIQPNLSGVNLQGANLSDMTKGLVEENTGILHAHLEGVAFSGFYLEGSSVVRPIVQHEFKGARLVARQLVGASLIGLTLKNAEPFPILDGADLSFAHMDGANCKESRFRGARLVRADFKNANVCNAKFGVANASNAEFDGADLSHTEFIRALLHDVTFVGTNLSHAIFEGAFLRGAKFEGALLIGTDLTGAKELEVGMIEKAFGTTDTFLPSGMARPKHWKDSASADEAWRSFRNKEQNQ